MRTFEGSGHEAAGRRGVGARKQRRLAGLAAALCAVCALALASAPSAFAEEATVTVEFACNGVTYHFSGFPNAPNNTIAENITIDGKIVRSLKFHFNGPTGSNTVSLTVPAGHHSYDARASWSTNGVRGGKDTPAPGGITCPADPGFEVEKVQRLKGSKTYTAATIPVAHVGQTVEYAIEVTNTGNVALKTSAVSDPGCEEITGGPAEIAVEGEAILFCHHVLTAADGEAGEHCNIATVTETPPEGGPKTQESNKVCVELPLHAKFTQEFSCKKITFKFFGFPKLPGNTVIENVYADGKNIFHGTFTFNGSSGENTIVLNLPPGKHKNLDARARWNTNGIRGGEDHILGFAECVPEPEFTIVDRQKIAGTGGEYSEAPDNGKVGETNDYDVTITNTGNVPFQITSFFDVFVEISIEHPVTCPTNPTGQTVEPGQSTQALCEYPLTEPGEGKDHATAEVKPSSGPSFSHESNSDVVNIAP
jgi:hypothetical protein